VSELLVAFSRVLQVSFKNAIRIPKWIFCLFHGQ